MNVPPGTLKNVRKHDMLPGGFDVQPYNYRSRGVGIAKHFRVTLYGTGADNYFYLDTNRHNFQVNRVEAFVEWFMFSRTGSSPYCQLDIPTLAGTYSYSSQTANRNSVMCVAAEPGLNIPVEATNLGFQVDASNPLTIPWHVVLRDLAGRPITDLGSDGWSASIVLIEREV